MLSVEVRGSYLFTSAIFFVSCYSDFVQEILLWINKGSLTTVKKQLYKSNKLTSYSLLSRPTKAQHTYIENILCIISTLSCFNASASSSGILSLVFVKVTKLLKLLKLQHNKSSRLKLSRDRCMIKSTSYQHTRNTNRGLSRLYMQPLKTTSKFY